MIRYYQQQLADLKAQNQFRQLPQLIHRGRFIQREDNTMLNMSSNDYLGLANNEALRQAFSRNTKINSCIDFFFLPFINRLFSDL